MEEEQQLLNFYGSFNKSNEDQPGLDMPSLDDRMFRRLMESVETSEPAPRMPARLVARLSIAATVIIALAASLYFYKDAAPQAEPEVFTEINQKNDIDPANNKAILTLADGSRISLDDVKNGFVASQGNISITKTEDGEIVYQKLDRGRNMGSLSAANTIQTPKGGRYNITLPDGSRVWLNSASTLSYPTAFASNERKVRLIGEAYFEVAKRKNVPFRVESNNQVVEVLGTHFNINSYEDEAYTKTTLLEGSVRIILNSAKPNAQLLKPGEQSLTSPAGPDIKVQHTDTEKAIAWKNGYFKFKNTPIRDIMREIERWYDVELVYDGKLAPDEFTGYISNDVKISGVLKMLEESGGIKFTVKGRKVKVKSIQ